MEINLEEIEARASRSDSEGINIFLSHVTTDMETLIEYARELERESGRLGQIVKEFLDSELCFGLPEEGCDCDACKLAKKAQEALYE